MGYPPRVKGYCPWDPKKQQFFNCADVIFNENCPDLVLTYPEQNHSDGIGDSPLPLDVMLNQLIMFPSPFFHPLS
jgi:hypothetical protein